MKFQRTNISHLRFSLNHGKVRHSMSKDTAFNGETTQRHTILCSDSQCLPPGDPKILWAKHEYPITGKSFIKSIFPQVYQAQYESTCACVIFEMAAIIKDLYGNSSNRLEKIDTRMNF